MSHRRRNGKVGWRSKRSNHGAKPHAGKERSQFCRDFRRSRNLSLLGR